MLNLSHSVHPPPPPFLLGGLNLQPNFEKGRPLQDLNFEKGVAGKEGGNFFQGEGLQFKKKSKI